MLYDGICSVCGTGVMITNKNKNDTCVFCKKCEKTLNLVQEISNKIHELHREYIHRNDLNQDLLEKMFEGAKDGVWKNSF